MNNELILIFHSSVLVFMTFIAAKIGRTALVSFFVMSMVLANLLILKQAVILGLQVTCTDAFIIAGMLGLNLIQELFGADEAQKAIWALTFVSLSVLVLTTIHGLYVPSLYDTAAVHYNALFSYVPRMVGASILVGFCSAQLERWTFGFLTTYFSGRLFALRNMISLGCSQTFDTLAFSFLGLYGVVASIRDIIVMSLAIKALLIISMSLFSSVIRRIILK